jgi:hypothetical protein
MHGRKGMYGRNGMVRKRGDSESPRILIRTEVRSSFHMSLSSLTIVLALPSVDWE